MMEAKLLPKIQSAYCAHHSTEMAVLKVLADILRALHSGKLVMLTLLDQFAALTWCIAMVFKVIFYADFRLTPTENALHSVWTW